MDINENEIKKEEMKVFLPTKKVIDRVIIEKYTHIYESNYDETSLEHARQGALLIVEWILNNK